jgi:hypothetical protein
MNGPNVKKQSSATHSTVVLPSAIVDTLLVSASDFWKHQEQILCGMETFAEGWFERRHAGTHAALEAAKRMCGAQTPVDLIREYLDWTSGALERVRTDVSACQQLLIAVASASAPADEAEESESARFAAKAA